MLASSAVMINWSDVAPEHRHAYYEWHSREHMVGRVALSGFCRGRRYLAEQASRDFLVMYEVQDVEVLRSAEYLTKANAPSPLTQRTTPYVKNAIRGLARVRSSHGIGTGGCALTLRFSVRAGSEDEVSRYLDDEVLPALARIPEITGAHRLVADREVSSIVPVERLGRPTAIPDWIVLIEGVTFDALSEIGRGPLSDERMGARGAAGPIERDTYRLQIMVTK